MSFAETLKRQCEGQRTLGASLEIKRILNQMQQAADFGQYYIETTIDFSETITTLQNKENGFKVWHLPAKDRPTWGKQNPENNLYRVSL